MARPDRRRRRLRLLKLEEAISRLEELGRGDRTLLRTSFRDAWAAEQGLQIAAEILLDTGNHILSGRAIGRSEKGRGNAEARGGSP